MSLICLSINAKNAKISTEFEPPKSQYTDVYLKEKKKIHGYILNYVKLPQNLPLLTTTKTLDWCMRDGRCFSPDCRTQNEFEIHQSQFLSLFYFIVTVDFLFEKFTLRVGTF